jgi:hypothetical protein
MGHPDIGSICMIKMDSEPRAEELKLNFLLAPDPFYLPKTFNPHQNDQGRKGPCFFQRLIALKCLKCQKIKKNI